MTIKENTICNLIQTFPVLLIMAQGHNRCLETPFIYKPPSPTQSPEYFQALDALFQNLYGHGHSHGHGYSHHGHGYSDHGHSFPGHEYTGHEAGHDHHQPCYTYSKKYGTKPCYISYDTGYDHYGYGNHGSGYGNHGSSYGNHGSGYGNYGSSYGNHGSGYGSHGTYAYVPKQGNIYGGNVTYGTGYAAKQGSYTANNRYKVVVKKTRIGTRKRKSGKLQVEDANSCKTVNGGKGSCINLYSCKPFMEVVRASYSNPVSTWMLRQSHCGFDDFAPKVCCPHEEFKNNQIESTTEPKINLIPTPNVVTQRVTVAAAPAVVTTHAPITSSPFPTEPSVRTSPKLSKITATSPKPTPLPPNLTALPPKPTAAPRRRHTTSGPVWGTTSKTTRSQRRDTSASNDLGSITSVGETCTTVYNTTGGCKDIYFCDPFLQLAKTAAKNPEAAAMLQRAQCGFDGKRPKVCCPLPELPDAPPPVRTTASPLIHQPVPAKNNMLSVALRASLPALPEPPVCGVSNISFNRVVGGVPAKLGAFPWMALVAYKDLLQQSLVSWKCGGALVSARHVLTAAHCIHHMEDIIYLVRLGELDLAREDEGATPLDVLIQAAIKHELYTPNKPVVNDIGILVLEKDVTFTALIRPICLPVSKQYRSMTFEQYNPFVAGWGNLKAGNSIAATHLQVAQVPVSEQAYCETAYPELRSGLFERAMCAGFPRGGADSCKGDSGGPLIQPLRSSSGGIAYYVIGVVSSGRRCAEGGGSPGLYARVSYYMPWIEEKMLGRAS